ncbi:MAG TPA: hypothetical protein VKU36_00025 [Candidatus Babeliales bacterium]|nr:hypothetical protein [Candidatus Babeliales bacterium]
MNRIHGLSFIPYWVVLVCSFITADESCIAYKFPAEFKHAVLHYIKQTETNYLQKDRRDSQEHLSYKKELRYLLKNYGRFSTSALLYRVRAAHQAMVKAEPDSNSESYKKYEQISSALLLVCAQVFCNDIRNQLLTALHDIDLCIIYWRYQQQHQLSYFFHKSPAKWIMGKSQVQEISYNIKRLEQKQKELYTFLGALTGHIHSFTDHEPMCEDCYTWMEELFTHMAPIFSSTHYDSDGTTFDDLAAQLNIHIKQVGALKSTVLKPIAFAKKPRHLVRNWIPYTVALAAAGYALHYYGNNYADLNKVLNAHFIALGTSWKKFVVTPTKDIWDTIFGKEDIQDQTNPDLERSISDFAKDLKELETKKDFNKETSNALAEYLKEDRKKTQQVMGNLLKKHVQENKITQEWCDTIIAAEQIGDVTKFQKFFNDMNKTLTDFYWNDDILDAVVVLAELKIYHYGSSLIQVVFELIVDYGIPVVKEALFVLSKGNREWDAVRKKVNLILNVAVLTPTIIVSGAGGRGIYKLCQWAMAHDYSPIRIALADINALLIESAAQLDNHAYGKLVYLIGKLRYSSIVKRSVGT